MHCKHDADKISLIDLVRIPSWKKHHYEVKLPGEEVIKLMANIIAELMYAQCDVNGNEYIMLEPFINYRK